MNQASTPDLQQLLEQIEVTYEFMLAFASRVTSSQHTKEDGEDPEIRQRLEELDRTLGLLDQACSSLDGMTAGDAQNQFVAVLLGDKQKAQAAVQLVLANSHISSQLVDNLNASIHLRALLTDLFLLDEATRQD